MYKAKENKNHPNAHEHTHTLNPHLKQLVGLLSPFNLHVKVLHLSNLILIMTFMKIKTAA